MTFKGLSQSQVAINAGVSQSTVSRALDGIPLRRGEARDKLFTYAGIKCISDRGRSHDPRATILATFDEIWDGSERHAIAVARVIASLGAFSFPSTSKPARLSNSDES